MKTFLKFFAIALLAIAVLSNCQTKEPAGPDKTSNEAIDKTIPDHFNTVVGEDQSGEYVLDDDIDDLISNWETKINNGSLITIDFDNVSIEMEDSKYFLVGVDDSENATSKIRLVLDSGTFYEISYPGPNQESEPTGSSCTCSGCTSTGPGSADDCVPRKDSAGDWYCTECPLGSGTCTKSVTVVEGEGVLD